MHIPSSASRPTPIEENFDEMALYSVGRFLELTGAALLVGGLAATVGIAQLAFGSPDILTREQAGRFMAKVFEASVFVEAGAVGLILLGSAARRSRDLVFAALFGFLVVAAHVWMVDRMTAIRTAHGGSVATLDPEDPDRKEFGRLHGFYALATIGLLAVGLGALYWGHAPQNNPSLF
jgi:hypothetical protein